MAAFDDIDTEDDGGALGAAETLLAFAITIAEGKVEEVRASDYRQAHKRLLRDATARRAASDVLIGCGSPDILWDHLRSVATGTGSWQLRRDAAHRLLDPVILALRQRGASPADSIVTDAVERIDAQSVREAWGNALDRRGADPRAAITSARGLLESTIKTILEDRGIEYDESADLPALYRAVSEELSVAPNSYPEQTFKQVLGGANSVVVGIGTLRNKAGDAHAPGRAGVRPDARHAALAVNLAGALALFLIETHEAVGRSG